MHLNISNDDKIVFQLYNPISQFDSVKEIWVSMLKSCPHAYFLSWACIETWINSLPLNCKLFLVVGYSNESPVIAFFLGSKTIIRNKFFKIRQLSLNSTLIPYIDDATHIEYNAILVKPEIIISLKSLLDNIPIKWDKLYIPRYSWTYSPNIILDDKVSQCYKLSISKRKGYYVNLDKVRRNNNDYLALLSPNRRKKILRSLKEYEKFGKVRIHDAENVEDALKVFEELIQLHQKRWTERGDPGTFSNEYVVDFHKNLISRQIKKGEIQLIRVSAGNHTIGCVYNYVYEGKVYAISGGFNYLPEKFYLPGFICDYLVVLHNAMLGLSCYDFLAGAESEYKNSLSTDEYEMQDIKVIKKSMKLKIEKLTVSLFQLFRKVKGLIFVKLLCTIIIVFVRSSC